MTTDGGEVETPTEVVAALDCIARHHSVTTHLPLADVVTACACTPGVQRDEKQWAEHFLAEAYVVGMNALAAELSGASTTSDARPPAASVDDRPATEEEAVAGRVIPFPTK